MQSNFLGTGVLLTCLLAAGAAFADHVTLSGSFDGSESMLAPMPGTCPFGADDSLGYRELGPVSVAATGDYHIVDAGNGIAVDVLISIYANDFNPADINANFVRFVDEGESLTLSAGTPYVLVVQHWCNNTTGTYGVAISGPGTITGTGVVKSPAHTLGSFASGDAIADFGNGPTRYDLNGPVQVERAGRHFYADLSLWQRTDMVLFVYAGAFDPANPALNRVGTLDDNATVDLQVGTDYYLVTVPFFTSSEGEWHYALFPPGPTTLNQALSGTWVNFDYLGQGVLMEVFQELNFVFLAWFTFDQAPAALKLQSAQAGSRTQAIGDTSQRWLTAYGNYAPGASSVDLIFENTTGGVFNALSPEQETDSSHGTGSLIVGDCARLRLDFELPSAPAAGSSDLERAAPDAVRDELCLELGVRPSPIE
jgi:hypothetical protein